jgi:hypothetical protein
MHRFTLHYYSFNISGQDVTWSRTVPVSPVKIRGKQRQEIMNYIAEKKRIEGVALFWGPPATESYNLRSTGKVAVRRIAMGV